MTNLTIDCQSLDITEERFYQLCVNNRNVKFERNHQGDLVIMTPVGDISSNRNAGIVAQLWLWNSQKTKQV